MENYTILGFVVLGIGLGVYLSWTNRKKNNEKFDYIFEEKKD